MRTFWPVAEAAQADYEALRDAALGGVAVASPAATVFGRAGLGGLIAAPAAEAAFMAHLYPARRPPWHPYDDPRLEALAAAFELVLSAPLSRTPAREAR
jgi:hypothetical protein